MKTVGFVVVVNAGAFSSSPGVGFAATRGRDASLCGRPDLDFG
jgi:hypothetical protein